MSTVDDWHAFGQMLLAGGELRGRRILREESVVAMTTSHVDGGPQHLFLDGQGWGFGGSVDIRLKERWNVLGRYGWVGGSGTTSHVVPSQDMIAVLLTRTAMTSPTPTEIMRDFWRYAARAAI